MGSLGTPFLGVKDHGTRPLNQHAGIPRKRAWKRALARADRQGCTIYKGTLLVASGEKSQPSKSSLRSDWQPRQTKPRRRLTFATWNSGGLPYQFLMHWLQETSLDVAIIAETKCTWTSNWTTANYHMVHSGILHGGLLIAVSRRLCASSDLSYEMVIPGRLVHVRLHNHSWPLDIIGVYQYAWAPENGKALNLSRREEVWHGLQKLIESLPNRNQLLIGGDFNTNLRPHKNLVGPKTHPSAWKPSGEHKNHKDQTSFQDLVQTQKLVALNTWHPGFKHTFKGNFGATSRIDFILTRHRDCDAIAKNTIPLEHCPLVDLRPGPQHLPIVGSLHRHAPHHKGHSPAHLTFHQRHTMLLHHTNDTPTWHTFQQHLPDITSFPDLQSYNHQLNYHCLTTFNHKYQPPTPVWQHNQFRIPAKQLWDLHHQFTRLRRTDLPSLLQAWQQITLFQKTIKQAKRQTHQIKKDQLQQALSIAANYAHHKDIYNWFRSISRLKHKPRNTTIQFRTTQGSLCDPKDECKQIKDYLHQLYTDNTFQFQAPPRITTMPFTTDELTASIQRLSGRTAGPPGIAPNLAWKAAAPQISSTIFEQLHQQWTTFPNIIIPTEWITSWIILLTKPNKPPNQPANLRPISLLHPISKAITRLLSLKARQAALPTLSKQPQFAYLPNRSTRDALIRAFHHCRETRTLTSTQANTTYQRYLNPNQVPSFIGGFLISIDINKAFDSVPRQQLIQALNSLNIPPSILHPLVAFLAPSPCQVHHKSHNSNFEATRGLRQGSTDAPFAWSVLMWSICQSLANSLGQEWVNEHVTIYADDILLNWTLRSTQDYYRAREDIVLFIQTLQSHGMTVNTSKSAMLMKITGSQSNHVQKHIRKTHLGPTYIIHTKEHTYQFPLRSKQEYLGTILSYGAFEKHTYHKRATQAQSIFEQLKPILRDHRHHTLQQRLKLYDMSVLTSLQYGLSVTGFTTTTSQQYHALVTKHYRYIAKSPIHITHENNQTLFQRLQRHPPLVQFDHAHVMWQQKQEATLSRLDTTDILHQAPPIPPLVPTRQADPPPDEDAPDTATSVCCATCHRPFEDIPSLKIHCTKLNHQLPPNIITTQPFCQVRDSLEGLPQCAHCCLPFKTWKGLRDHINLGRCSTPPAPQDIEVRPMVHRPSIALHLHSRSFAGLFNDKSVYYELVHNCGFCRRWCADNTSMSHHYRKEHPALYKELQAFLKEIRQHSGIGTGKGICRLCQQTATQLSKHKCPVVMQMAAMHVAHNENQHYLAPDLHPAEPPEDSRFVCPTCQTVCKTALSLRQHQGSSKCVPPQTKAESPFTCKLCNTTYKDMKGLQRHNKRQHPNHPLTTTEQTNKISRYIQPSTASTHTPPTSCETTAFLQSPLSLPTDATYNTHRQIQHHGHLILQAIFPFLQELPTVVEAITDSIYNPPSQHHLFHTTPPPRPLTLRPNKQCVNTILTFHYNINKPPATPTAKLWLKPQAHHHVVRLYGTALQLRGRDGRPQYLHEQSLGHGSPEKDETPHTYRCPPTTSNNPHTSANTTSNSTTIDDCAHPIGATTREDHPGSMPRYGPDDVHSHRTRIHSPIPGRHHTTMAPTASAETGHTVAPVHTDGIHPQGAPLQSHQGASLPQRGRAQDQASSTGIHQGQPLDIPHVGPATTNQQADSRTSTALCRNSADSGHPDPGPPDTSPEPFPRPSIFEPQRQRGDPMENHSVTSLSTGSLFPRRPDQTHQELSHTIGAHAPEGSQPAVYTHGIAGAQAPTSSHGPNLEGQRQRQGEKGHILVARLKHMTFQNDGNWCWLNAIYITYGIALLEWIADGNENTKIPWVYEQLLHQTPQSLAHVRDLIPVHEFEGKLHNYGVDQQDAGEAIHWWLQLIQCDCTDMGWHLRKGRMILDSGGFHQPICLTLPSSSKKKWRLQSLIKQWHLETRGKAALLKPSPLVCLQIGRFQKTGSRRQDLVYWDFSSIQIPTFAAQGEETIWRHYRLRGGIVHHGQKSTSGHYQGFIITPDEDYLLWDDDREPCQVQDHPMIFQQLVIVWATLIAPGDHFYSDVESLHTIASDDECLGLDPMEVTSHAASLEIQARKRTIARRHRRMTKQKTLRNKTKPEGQLGQLLETSFGNRLSG